MKDILFRAKRTDNGKWERGFYFKQIRNLKIGLEHLIIEPLFGKKYKVIPETVDQFIGYTDKEDNYIFESDIVEFTRNDNSKEKYLIWFHNEGQYLTAVPIDEHLNFNGSDYWNSRCDGTRFNYAEFTVMLNDFYGDFKNIEVIGNLHDNPELLGNEMSITSLNSRWLISSDGYYPYCPKCHYRPNGELKRFCANCGMDMLGE